MALVGIDLGGTQLRVAVADERGRLRTIMRRPTEAARGRQHVIGRIVAAVADALAEDKTPAGRVRALGIGLPGPGDPSGGLVISPANLPGFRNVPLNRILTRATGIPSYLHHDAHLAALGEHRRGAGRGASELIYVTVSTGMGRCVPAAIGAASKRSPAVPALPGSPASWVREPPRARFISCRPRR